MTGPYRDQHLTCPACKATLREFRTRQVCDACEGMMLTLADLGEGIHDLTSIHPGLEIHDPRPGDRPCPHCGTPMTRCKLRVLLETEIARPRPELDQCAEHGIWFDAQELAQVLEKVAGKGYGGGVGRKGGHGVAGVAGVGSSEGWSAMFKKFGGHGGW